MFSARVKTKAGTRPASAGVNATAYFFMSSFLSAMGSAGFDSAGAPAGAAPSAGLASGVGALAGTTPSAGFASTTGAGGVGAGAGGGGAASCLAAGGGGAGLSPQPATKSASTEAASTVRIICFPLDVFSGERNAAVMNFFQ